MGVGPTTAQLIKIIRPTLINEVLLGSKLQKGLEVHDLIESGVSTTHSRCWKRGGKIRASAETNRLINSINNIFR
jgi:hypothetical protein